MDNKNKGLILISLLILTAILTTGEALAQENPMITFRFDDGLIGQYDYAGPILGKYNFPATAYIFTDPPEAGDWEGYMNWPQIEELRNVYGWEIGSHSKSHPDLTQLSDSRLIEELQGSKAILESHGFAVKSFASPFGYYNNKVLSFIARFYESHPSAGPYNFNIFPFSDYEISVQEVRNSTSLRTIKDWIDEAALSKKWLILLFHDLVQSNPTEYQYSKDNFELIVDYVKIKNIPVVNISEALEIAGKNLVPNPSFEDFNFGLEDFSLGAAVQNWADKWLRTDTSHIILDTNHNGNSPYPKNSLKFIGGSDRYKAYTKDFIAINPNKAYLLKTYFNCQDFQSGGVDVFIDEYDSQGNWINWKWQTGIWNKYVGVKTAIYTPDQNAAKLLIWFESVSGSNLTCYIDNVVLSEISQFNKLIKVK